MRVKDSIVSVIIFILYSFFLSVYFLGVFHAFKKHSFNEGVVGAIAFPYGIYLGFEYWWHDDFKDVDWNKRLPNDLKSCIYFVTVSNDKSTNQYQFNEDLESFSNKINKYPLEKKQYLHNGIKLYINYYNNLYKDFFSSINKSNESEQLILSELTKNIEIQLTNYNLNEEIQYEKKYLEELITQLNYILSENSDASNNEIIKVFMNTYILKLDIRKKEFSRVFKSLFNEDL